MRTDSSQSQVFRYIYGFLSIFPILLIGYQFVFIAQGFPFEDDFRVTLKYLHRWISSEGFYSKVGTLFSPENESTPIVQKLFVALPYTLFGDLYLKAQLLIPILLLGGIVGYIFYKKSYNEHRLYLFALFSLVFFNLLHQELFFRFDVSSYQLFALTMACLAFYGSEKWEELGFTKKTLFWFALFLAPFGSINGLITCVLIPIIFILKKQIKPFGVSILILIIQLGILSFLSEDTKSIGILDTIQKYAFELPFAFFVSLGGSFNIFHIAVSQWICFGVGILLLIYWILLFWNLPLRTHLFAWGFSIFLWGSLAAIVTLRYNFWYFGIETVLESRYKIYGCLLFVLCVYVHFQKQESINTALKFGLMVLAISIQGIGYIKGNFLMKKQALTQYTDSYNLKQGSIIPQFAMDRFIPNAKYEYLKKETGFRYETYSDKLEKTLAAGEIIPIKSYEFKELGEQDPTLLGDWNRLHISLTELKIKGSIKKYRYYFGKITDSQNQNLVVFLNPPGQSFVNRIIDSEESFEELNREFYLHFYDSRPPYRIQVYGCNELK
ncbi:MAG: hypothetical protein ACRCVT_16430 [Leadbetterella sp.]